MLLLHYQPTNYSVGQSTVNYITSGSIHVQHSRSSTHRAGGQRNSRANFISLRSKRCRSHKNGC